MSLLFAIMGVKTLVVRYGACCYGGIVMGRYLPGKR